MIARTLEVLAFGEVSFFLYFKVCFSPFCDSIFVIMLGKSSHLIIFIFFCLTASEIKCRSEFKLAPLSSAFSILLSSFKSVCIFTMDWTSIKAFQQSKEVKQIWRKPPISIHIHLSGSCLGGTGPHRNTHFLHIRASELGAKSPEHIRASELGAKSPEL